MQSAYDDVISYQEFVILIIYDTKKKKKIDSQHDSRFYNYACNYYTEVNPKLAFFFFFLF